MAESTRFTNITEINFLNKNEYTNDLDVAHAFYKYLSNVTGKLEPKVLKLISIP